jgi:hypothetical protein
MERRYTICTLTTKRADRMDGYPRMVRCLMAFIQLAQSSSKKRTADVRCANGPSVEA